MAVDKCSGEDCACKVRRGRFVPMSQVVVHSLPPRPDISLTTVYAIINDKKKKQGNRR